IMSSPTKWSPQQDAALVAAASWLKDPTRSIFRLFGFAGTGKTTLAKTLAQDAGAVAYGAFTGKAASAMRKAGCDGARTLHSLLYTRMDEKAPPDPHRGPWRLSDDTDLRGVDLLVVDEVSMVNGYMGLDLLGQVKKVLVLGDPFQLPPVKGSGFFMGQKPDV